MRRASGLEVRPWGVARLPNRARQVEESDATGGVRERMFYWYDGKEARNWENHRVTEREKIRGDSLVGAVLERRWLMGPTSSFGESARSARRQNPQRCQGGFSHQSPLQLSVSAPVR